MYNHDVIGSSNLKDIKDFCERNGIAYLTTCDFLWYAWKRGKMTLEEIESMVENVANSKSKLPRNFDVTHHVPSTQM